MIRFGWDPSRNRANRRDHGIGFHDAKAVFNGPTLERWDDREDYGEERWVAIGFLEGIEITVVYTDLHTRNGVVRQIIYARRATRDEREAYYRRTGG